MQATRHPPQSADPLAGIEHALLSAAKRVLGKGRPAEPSHSEASGHKVERTGYHALASLEACGELRLSDLAAVLELDASTVSRQVRLLEGLGLLQRTRDPHDGRVSLLGLSGRGREELAAQRVERHAVLQRALASWAPADRQRLLELLERLSSSLADPTMTSTSPTTSPTCPAADNRPHTREASE